MCFKYEISYRLTVLLFAILSLAIANFNAVNTVFAVRLIYHTGLDDHDTNKGTSNDTFKALINILICVSIAAIVNTVFALYGSVISIHSSWLPMHKTSILPTYAFSHVFQAFISIWTGMYVTKHAYGLQPLFKRYSGNEVYYGIMYYGSIAQVVYGSSLVSLSITLVVPISLANYLERRQKRASKAVKEVARTAEIHRVELSEA